MKRILILGDINSSHIQKWCISLAQAGHHIGVFSLSIPSNKWYERFENILVFAPFHFTNETFHSSIWMKLKYLKAIPKLKEIIKQFNPDILHAHYATSYGIIGALSGFHPFLIYTWGSDLMEFPYKTLMHSKFLKFIFSRADQIFATSKTLASHAEKFTDKKIVIIPFGVDTAKFKPDRRERLFAADNVVIGTVKSLEKIYGIDVLINAFAILNSKYSELNMRLLLVGSGTRESEYKRLVKDLDIDKLTVFTGRLPHGELNKYYNMLDIFVNVSHNESFGVSVLEASACEKPVIVSNVGGLIEVVKDNITGLIIPPKNIEATVAAVEKLVENENLRTSLGRNGRKFVSENYNWNVSVEEMMKIYDNF